MELSWLFLPMKTALKFWQIMMESGCCELLTTFPLMHQGHRKLWRRYFFAEIITYISLNYRKKKIFWPFFSLSNFTQPSVSPISAAAAAAATSAGLSDRNSSVVTIAGMVSIIHLLDLCSLIYFLPFFCLLCCVNRRLNFILNNFSSIAEWGYPEHGRCQT